jgi:hypothetical protein
MILATLYLAGAKNTDRAITSKEGHEPG